ncbi:hypothetical protein LCGC14_1826050 [marine sediment metagenome]|uniref:Uncharacterized protein n=1 Tax=marine sediment metagenome TaxID=412755 RepID=A0A0F9IX79_9ZZZZ
MSTKYPCYVCGVPSTRKVYADPMRRVCSKHAAQAVDAGYQTTQGNHRQEATDDD